MLDMLLVRQKALQMTTQNLETMIQSYNATIEKLETKLAKKEESFNMVEFQNGDNIRLIENYGKAGENPIEISDFRFR